MKSTEVANTSDDTVEVARDSVPHKSVARKPQTRHDPRWARELPWKLPDDAWSFVVPTLIGGAVLSLILVVAPGLLVTRMIRRRQWGTRTLFALSALVGLMVLVSTSSPPLGLWAELGPLPGPALRWIIALAATPPVVLLLRLGAWAVRREWRPLAWWSGSIVVASLLLATVLLLLASAAEPLLSDEYYRADGWYSILGQGYYVVSWLQPPLTAFAAWWRGRGASSRENRSEPARAASQG